MMAAGKDTFSCDPSGLLFLKETLSDTKDQLPGIHSLLRASGARQYHLRYLLCKKAMILASISERSYWRHNSFNICSCIFPIRCINTSRYVMFIHTPPFFNKKECALTHSRAERSHLKNGSKKNNLNNILYQLR